MDLFSADTPQIVRMLVSLFIVIAMMGGFAYILRRLGLAGTEISTKTKDKRRLSIVESLPLDARRRLVIVQRDNVQHLIILGISGETVVETNIPPVDSSPETKPSAS